MLNDKATQWLRDNPTSPWQDNPHIENPYVKPPTNSPGEVIVAWLIFIGLLFILGGGR